MREKSIEQLISEAKARFDKLSPAEQAQHLNAQRESWVRGEMGMGNDTDEAEYREKLRRERVLK